MHPLDKIREWFDSLERDTRMSMTTKLGGVLPLTLSRTGLEESLGDGRFEVLPGAQENGDELLVEWLSARGCYHEDLGRIVALRALVTFFLTRDEAWAESWQWIRQFHERLRSGAEQRGNASMASFAQDQVDRLPVQEARWREAVRRWNDLRVRELSDAALAEWERAAEIAARGTSAGQAEVRPFSTR